MYVLQNAKTVLQKNVSVCSCAPMLKTQKTKTLNKPRNPSRFISVICQRNRNDRLESYFF